GWGGGGPHVGLLRARHGAQLLAPLGVVAAQVGDRLDGGGGDRALRRERRLLEARQRRGVAELAEREARRRLDVEVLVVERAPQRLVGRRQPAAAQELDGGERVLGRRGRP